MSQETKLTWGIIDNSKHTATSHVYISKLAAIDFQAISDAVDSFQSILATLTRGNIGRMTVVDPRDTGAPVAPADPEAQNEIRLRLDLMDSVTYKTSYLTIGSPEVSNIVTSQSNIIDIANSTDVLALKNWVESFGRSDVGNPLLVTGAMLVGRTSG
jgi:hypothetical protein